MGTEGGSQVGGDFEVEEVGTYIEREMGRKGGGGLAKVRWEMKILREKKFRQKSVQARL